MNLKIWCKSFLSIYHLIPTIISSIDRRVFLRAIKSSDFSHMRENTTLNEANFLLNLTEKKVSFINLKILTDECLLEMDKKKSKILFLRYIDNVCSKDIIDILKMSRRTFFRRLNSALSEFESLFYRKLLQNESLFRSFCNEAFFDDLFSRIDEFERETQKSKLSFEKDLFSENVCKFIVNRMRKVI